MGQKRFRTQSILIDTREGRRVFKSAAEIPPDWRRPLEKALDGELTATIIIADVNGRPEALKRVRDAVAGSRHSEFPYARQAVLAGLAAFLVWVFATLR
ncbi:MAG: hypothetical protein KJZ84_19895 [Bryobacteraceae bacterium]|nr:hypothetical protein [Bryobacteraceae bacterium]